MGIEDTMSKMNETKNKLENLGQTIDILRETIFNALRKAIEGVERLKD